MNRNDVRTKMLLDHLDSVFYGKAWHGASLLRSVAKFDWERALLENEEGFSAWKIVLHCAYWKFDVRRTITLEGPPPSFPRKPRNFPRLPDTADATAWKADRAFLVEQHRLLQEAVAGFPASRLDDKPEGRPFSYAGYILGAASHDVYHTAHVRNLGILQF